MREEPGAAVCAGIGAAFPHAARCGARICEGSRGWRLWRAARSGLGALREVWQGNSPPRASGCWGFRSKEPRLLSRAAVLTEKLRREL